MKKSAWIILGIVLFALLIYAIVWYKKMKTTSVQQPSTTTPAKTTAAADISKLPSSAATILPVGIIAPNTQVDNYFSQFQQG